MLWGNVCEEYNVYMFGYFVFYVASFVFAKLVEEYWWRNNLPICRILNKLSVATIILCFSYQKLVTTVYSAKNNSNCMFSLLWDETNMSRVSIHVLCPRIICQLLECLWKNIIWTIFKKYSITVFKLLSTLKKVIRKVCISMWSWVILSHQLNINIIRLLILTKQH